MLLFVDGFDHYVTADLGKKWTTVGANCSISAGNGRRGGAALLANNSTAMVMTLAASASWVLGAAFSIASFSAVHYLFILQDAGTAQVRLQTNTDGTLSVLRNLTVVATSALALSTSAFYFIEMKVTIADSIAADSCKVRVNGVDWITVAAGTDLKNTANASANQVGLADTGAANVYTDDFYTCDQAGSTNNDFLGDVRIDTLYPTSDGNYAQFTPSTGTDHFALVDETVPNTTDYNSGMTVGDRDSYGMGNLAALTSQTVYGVQVNAAILKDDAGAKSAATMVRSSTTDADGVSVGLGTSQVYISQVYELNPNGSVAWTETTVNAMEAGVVVTA